MNKKEYLRVLGYIGTALFFLGLGWFFGRTFGKIEISLRIFLIFFGIILFLLSFAFPKKK